MRYDSPTSPTASSQYTQVLAVPLSSLASKFAYTPTVVAGGVLSSRTALVIALLDKNRWST